MFRSSRISCDSDVTESQSSSTQESNLGRSASTGMVNVDRESWQRVAEGKHLFLISLKRFQALSSVFLFFSKADDAIPVFTNSIREFLNVI
jgi:hypothetical protein